VKISTTSLIIHELRQDFPDTLNMLLLAILPLEREISPRVVGEPMAKADFVSSDTSKVTEERFTQPFL
jgi:hypothetical protein